MGSLVRGLLKKAPPFRVISSLYVNNTNPNPLAISNLLCPLQINSPEQSNSSPSPSADSSAQYKLQSPVFPSFPFGFFPGPIHPSGLLDLVPALEKVKRSDETATIWADSVKKKRKRKMNKHKYRKRRKRLRRKT